MKFQVCHAVSAFANLVALFMVLGTFLHYGAGRTDMTHQVKEETMRIDTFPEPTISLRELRKTGSKGKGKGKGKGSDEVECIPLSTTPAPTKGKGKSVGSKSKGKGKGSSEAPVSKLRHSEK